MKSTRARKAAYQSIVATVLILTPQLTAEAQLNHTANYRGFGRFFCGSEWVENTLNCDLTAEPRNENDLADLVQEFARLTVLSASEDEIEEADLIETGFFRLCEENPARCLGWVADFARTGSLDGDIDGVLDGADACPDTSTAISQAQAILFSQEVALLEVEQVLRQVRERLIRAANGTLGDAERVSIGESLVPLYHELVSRREQESGTTLCLRRRRYNEARSTQQAATAPSFVRRSRSQARRTCAAVWRAIS